MTHQHLDYDPHEVMKELHALNATIYQFQNEAEELDNIFYDIVKASNRFAEGQQQIHRERLLAQANQLRNTIIEFDDHEDLVLFMLDEDGGFTTKQDVEVVYDILPKGKGYLMMIARIRGMDIEESSPEEYRRLLSQVQDYYYPSDDWVKALNEVDGIIEELAFMITD